MINVLEEAAQSHDVSLIIKYLKKGTIISSKKKKGYQSKVLYNELLGD